LTFNSPSARTKKIDALLLLPLENVPVKSVVRNAKNINEEET